MIFLMLLLAEKTVLSSAYSKISDLLGNKNKSLKNCWRVTTYNWILSNPSDDLVQVTEFPTSFRLLVPAPVPVPKIASNKWKKFFHWNHKPLI